MNKKAVVIVLGLLLTTVVVIIAVSVVLNKTQKDKVDVSNEKFNEFVTEPVVEITESAEEEFPATVVVETIVTETSAIMQESTQEAKQNVFIEDVKLLGPTGGYDIIKIKQSSLESEEAFIELGKEYVKYCTISIDDTETVTEISDYKFDQESYSVNNEKHEIIVSYTCSTDFPGTLIYNWDENYLMVMTY